MPKHIRCWLRIISACLSVQLADYSAMAGPPAERIIERLTSEDGWVQRRAVQDLECLSLTEPERVLPVFDYLVRVDVGDSMNSLAVLRVVDNLTTPGASTRAVSIIETRARGGDDSPDFISYCISRLIWRQAAIHRDTERLFDSLSPGIGKAKCVLLPTAQSKRDDEASIVTCLEQEGPVAVEIARLLAFGAERIPLSRDFTSALVRACESQDEEFSALAWTALARASPRITPADIGRLRQAIRTTRLRRCSSPAAVEAFALARITRTKGDLRTAAEAAAFSCDGRPQLAGHTTAAEAIWVADLLVDESLLQDLVVMVGEDTSKARRAGALNILTFVGRRAETATNSLLRTLRTDRSEIVREFAMRALISIADIEVLRLVAKAKQAYPSFSDLLETIIESEQ